MERSCLTGNHVRNAIDESLIAQETAMKLKLREKSLGPSSIFTLSSVIPCDLWTDTPYAGMRGNCVVLEAPPLPSDQIVRGAMGTKG
jgi:hypothetical protein